jgi:hypothetical protein
MHEPRPDPILQRLERLEQRLRRWQWLGGVALGLVGLTVLLGVSRARGPDLVQATAVYVVDHTGRTRAALVLGDGGAPALGLRDAQGQLRAVLSLLPDGSPRLVFTDARDQIIWQAP